MGLTWGVVDRHGDLILRVEGPRDARQYVCLCLFSELVGGNGKEFGYCLLVCVGFIHRSNLRVLKDNVSKVFQNINT
jgi:hypothetical protein